MLRDEFTPEEISRMGEMTIPDLAKLHWSFQERGLYEESFADMLHELSNELHGIELYWTSYELPERKYTEPELKRLYRESVDHYEYPEFWGWAWDMERSGVIFLHETSVSGRWREEPR